MVSRFVIQTATTGHTDFLASVRSAICMEHTESRCHEGEPVKRWGMGGFVGARTQAKRVVRVICHLRASLDWSHDPTVLNSLGFSLRLLTLAIDSGVPANVVTLASALRFQKESLMRIWKMPGTAKYCQVQVLMQFCTGRSSRFRELSYCIAPEDK